MGTSKRKPARSRADRGGKDTAGLRSRAVRARSGGWGPAGTSLLGVSETTQPQRQEGTGTRVSVYGDTGERARGAAAAERVSQRQGLEVLQHANAHTLLTISADGNIDGCIKSKYIFN